MPKALWKRQNGILITEIAMNVRMAAGGQADMYDGFAQDYYLLKQALLEWEPSVAQWTERVDGAVRNLIEAVILEAERSDGFWINAELARLENNV